MNPSTTEEFFSIQLSENGTKYLLRLFSIVRWVFILASLFHITISITLIMQFVKYQEIDVSNRFIGFMSLRFSPIFTMAMNTLWVLHLYLFFRFSGLCKKAIHTRQSDLFNHSFKWLVRSVMVAFFQLIVEIPFGLTMLYLTIIDK